MWRSKYFFFISYTDQRQIMSLLLQSSQQCHFHVSLVFLFCVSVDMWPLNLQSIWKKFVDIKLSRWRENLWEMICFYCEWEIRGWLGLRLVCWTLRNNNMVTAARMLASIIFQKLNPGWKKMCLRREAPLSWKNKKINVNSLCLIKFRLLQTCSHVE